MRILMINSVADRISTGQIMYELYLFLKNCGHEVRFCYGRGKIIDNEDFERIDSQLEFFSHIAISRITGLQGYYSNLATTRLLKTIKEFNPEIVVLGNIHGYYLNAFRLLNYLKQRRIMTVYYMFDEYAFLGKCAFFDNCDRFKSECSSCPKKKGYPKSLIFDTSTKIFRDKLKVYSGFDTLRFVSVPYTVSRSKESALFRETNAIVYSYGWGIDTHVEFVPMDNEPLRKKLGIPDENVVILAVAPYSNPRKGIKQYYYKIAEQLKDLPFSFVHVGFDGTEEEKPKNVMTIPFVREQKELASYFSLADLFVITSVSEGFPTVCLDALSCGTPICGFDTSGTPYVAPAPYGHYIQPFDFVKMSEYIKQTGKKTKVTIKACRQFAENNLDSARIFGKMMKQIEIELHS